MKLLSQKPALSNGRPGVSARLVASILVVGWLFAVVVSYYVVHKPVSLGLIVELPEALGNTFGKTLPQVLAALANLFGNVLTVATIVLFALVLGHRLCKAWVFPSPLEAVVMWTGLGLGASGFIVFALAAVGIVNQWLYWGFIAVTFVFLRSDVRAVVSVFRAISLPRPTRGDTALALFCAIALSVTFLFALTPPWGWDGLQYHLITPKLILENGRMLPPPDNPSLSYPGLVEMLFLFAMVLKDDGATQAMHWIFLPLTLGAVLSFAQKYFSPRIGWLASALFCAVPTIVLIATWAYNDLALTFYSFAAFAVALRARETHATRDFVLVGLLCGFALGEKVTAFFVPLALALLLFRAERAVVFKIALMLVVTGILAAPWWVRNIIFVGNPIYPFVFGGKYWDAFRTAWYTRFGSGLLQRPLELLIVPWTMTVFGTQSDFFQATLGPLLLALVPLNLIPSKAQVAANRRVIRAMWFLAAVLYLVWLLGVAQSNLLWQARLLLPAFPIFCLLAAMGLERLRNLVLPQFSIAFVANFVVAFVLILTAASYTLALVTDRAPGYFLGAVSRAEYLSGMLGAHYDTAQWVNHNLPDGASIQFLWEPRAYYFSPQATADAFLDRFPHLVYLYGDADAIAEHLRAEGFTHVLVYREGLDNLLQSGADPTTNRDMEILSDFVSGHLKPLYGASDLLLEMRNGKLGLANVNAEPYAVYELTPK